MTAKADVAAPSAPPAGVTRCSASFGAAQLSRTCHQVFQPDPPSGHRVEVLQRPRDRRPGRLEVPVPHGASRTTSARPGAPGRAGTADAAWTSASTASPSAKCGLRGPPGRVRPSVGAKRCDGSVVHLAVPPAAVLPSTPSVQRGRDPRRPRRRSRFRRPWQRSPRLLGQAGTSRYPKFGTMSFHPFCFRDHHLRIPICRRDRGPSPRMLQRGHHDD